MALKDEKDIKVKPEKKKSKIILLLIAAIGALIVGGLIMGAVVYYMGIPGITPKAKESAHIELETLELGERVVNLSDSGGGRYLRVRMVLEFAKNEKLATELKQKNATIMEEVLHVFRSKTVDDIRPLDKEEIVKTEILSSINSTLQNGKVERIYFTDFLIQ